MANLKMKNLYRKLRRYDNLYKVRKYYYVECTLNILKEMILEDTLKLIIQTQMTDQLNIVICMGYV